MTHRTHPNVAANNLVLDPVTPAEAQIATPTPGTTAKIRQAIINCTLNTKNYPAITLPIASSPAFPLSR